MKATATIPVVIYFLGAAAHAQQISAEPQRQEAATPASTRPATDAADWSAATVSDGAGGAYIEDHSMWGDE